MPETLPAFPKPKQIRQHKPAFETYEGGREVCLMTPAGRREYQRRRTARWMKDGGTCCLCGTYVPLSDCTVEHPDGRGMGGSKRDDRVSVIRIAHDRGNSAKGSMTLELYLQKPLEERKRLCGVVSQQTA